MQAHKRETPRPGRGGWWTVRCVFYSYAGNLQRRSSRVFKYCLRALTGRRVNRYIDPL
jgi:hypothetical protein